MVAAVNEKNTYGNLAITIGRLGLVCPAEVAPNLQQFIRQWSVLILIYFSFQFFNLFCFSVDLT
jgi:hypothetical protein